MELEYSEELDAHYVILPESLLRRLGIEEGDMLDFDVVDSGILTIFKI